MESWAHEETVVLRYYLELGEYDGQISAIVVQAEEGIFYIWAEGKPGVFPLWLPSHFEEGPRWIRLPEWPKPRGVTSVADRDFLDFIRREERPIYMYTIPTEIREEGGTIKELRERIFARGW